MLQPSQWHTTKQCYYSDITLSWANCVCHYKLPCVLWVDMVWGWGREHLRSDRDLQMQNWINPTKGEGKNSQKNRRQRMRKEKKTKYFKGKKHTLLMFVESPIHSQLNIDHPFPPVPPPQVCPEARTAHAIYCISTPITNPLLIY